MKLEYLASGSSDCPLIRLYDFTPTEASHLHAVIVGIAEGVEERVEVHELPFIEVIGQCRLTLIRRGWDQGIVRTDRSAEFECGFTVATWDNVAGLIEPFINSAKGYQWLAGTPGEMALLLSASGEW